MAEAITRKEDIDMAKYRLKKRERGENDESKPDNEIRITSHGRVTTYISYAAKQFLEVKETDLVLKATGQALANAVTVAEVLKRRFKGLHQLNDIGSREVFDEYEPISDKDDLEPIKLTRNVSFIEIKMSLKDGKLDSKDKGYQSPIDESLVEEYDPERHDKRRGGRGSQGDDEGSDDDDDEKPKRKGKGKGKGKKGGKGKGGKGKGGKDGKGKGKKGKDGKGKGKKGGKKGKGKGKRSRSGDSD